MSEQLNKNNEKSEMISTKDIKVAFIASVAMKRNEEANALYNPEVHTWNWAARNGYLSVIQWLHENKKDGCTDRTMDYAARKGALDTVKWLHQHRTEGCTIYAMNKAAEYGHLDVLKWLHENRTEGCSARIMDKAAEFGQLDVVKWLHENRTEGCTTSAMVMAADEGHLDVVKWLHKNRTEGCDHEIWYSIFDPCDGTISYDEPDPVMLRWFLQHKPEYFKHVKKYEEFEIKMDDAAEKGELQELKWFQKNYPDHVRFTTNAMDGAAASGHLKVLEWLHANRTEGCSKEAMNNAAQKGHLNVITWLYKNRKEGCPSEAMQFAAWNNKLHIVTFISQNLRRKCGELNCESCLATKKNDFYRTINYNERRERYDFDSHEYESDGYKSD